ncbi:MAG: metallophosphoesterase [Planctomycetia bacterium]|nr:metallophosphoesterase [Planctomycetia bacterium]
MNTISYTRRRFLGTVGATATTLVLRPSSLRAAGEKRSDLAFVVVTDTHLGYNDKDSAEQQWLKTAAAIDAAPGAFVLHLGDIVDGGREAQYPKYVAGRKLIRKPVHEVPGNHDPAELFRKYVRPDIDMAFDHDWLRVVLLGNAHRDSHDGFITADQISWLTDQCAGAAKQDKLLLFAMHVPVHENKHPDRGWFVKPASGQKEFYALLGSHAERTVAVLHGHFHNGLRGWSDHGPVHEIVFPSALYNQDRGLEKQNAPGYNLPEFRAGFTRVNIRDGAIELSYQPLGAEQPATKTLARKPA